MKKIKLKYIIISAVLLVGVFFSVSGIFGKYVQVSTEQLTNRDLVVTVEVSATVAPEKSISAVSLFGGKVNSVLVEVGDTVKKGEVLVKLDDERQSKAYEQAMSLYEDYTGSTAVSAGAANSYSKETARKAIAMSQSLGAEYQDFLDTFLGSSAVFSADTSTEAQKLLSNAEATKAALDDTTIKATSAGKVVSVGVAEGGMAQPGIPVVTIAQEGKLSLLANVFESDAKNIKAGQEALITANGKDYVGKIDKVFLISGETQTGSYTAAALSKLGSVTITPPSIFSDMLGASCNVSIVMSKKEGCQSINLDSIIDGEYVYVVLNNKKLEKRQITLGEKNDYYAEVLSGLSADDIIVKNVSDVDENSKVVIKND